VIESLMTEELTRKIVAWATEITSAPPSNRARDAYLAERRRRAHTKPRLERCGDGKSVDGARRRASTAGFRNAAFVIYGREGPPLGLY
jgi:hypothetical protein